MTDPADASDYDRGRKAGVTDATLKQHEQRLDVINGSIVDTKNAVEAQRKSIELQTLTLQKLSDKVEAGAQAALMLAAALKEADEARRTADVTSAQPAQRRQSTIMVVVAVVGMLVGLVGMYVLVRGG